MSEKKLLMAKKKLVSKLEENVQEMMIGSLYEAMINCKIESCKKCKDGKKGHKSNRLGYYTSTKKHKVAYIRKEEVVKVKKYLKKFEETKKIIIDIGEINFLIMKESRKS